MNNPVAGAEAKALEAFDRYRKQDWSIRDEFDSNMSERLPEDLLASGWSQVAAALGQLNKLGSPAVRVAQDHTVVEVPMSFERGR